MKFHAPAAAMCCLIGLLVLASGGLIAQSEGPAEEADAARRKPLPTYFGKLGVSEKQRETLYEIRDRYDVKIAELQRQIDQLTAQRDADMEAALTQGQKLRLKELREEARQRELQENVAETGEDSAQPAENP